MNLGEIEVGDAMKARKQDTSGKTELVVDEVKDERLGGFFSKSKLRVLASSGKKSYERLLDVIVKEVPSYRGDTEIFGNEKVGQKSAERYYHRWKYLKKLGIPVVSSMRVVDAHHVVMGDMTADGSAFVGQETYEELKKNEGKLKRRDLEEHEKLFLGLDKNMIKAEVLRIFKIAWDNGIQLSTDMEEFAVLVAPSGDHKVLVKDHGEMHKLREVKAVVVGFEKCCKELEERVDYLFEGLRNLEN